jgi:predicted kinase
MAIDSSKREFRDVLRKGLERQLVLLTGARQAGKTTLARQLVAGFDFACRNACQRSPFDRLRANGGYDWAVQSSDTRVGARSS